MGILYDGRRTTFPRFQRDHYNLLGLRPNTPTGTIRIATRFLQARIDLPEVCAHNSSRYRHHLDNHV